MAEKVIHSLSVPFKLGGNEAYVGASLGISVYPDDGLYADDLMRNADIAMYRAKQEGRNAYRFYTQEMDQKMRERQDLENHLRHAIKNKEFLLHYQPRVDLKSGAITGMEALIRWQHPERGLIQPSKFIPVAEETGLIEPIGEWVLSAACAQAASWQARGLRPARIAVNLSARQFRQANLVQIVRRELEKAQLAPLWLELEITEGTVMYDTESAVSTLRELKAMGVALAIDDFGTGYSSLSYLKTFPIDVLKVDRSFVKDVTHDPDDAAITRTVVAMAHSLGLKVVAEGVETEAQLGFLRACHCDELQGYLFSPPVVAEEMARFLVMERPFATLVGESDPEAVCAMLVVDDETNILSGLRRGLRGEPYRIIVARNVAQAFELLATHDVQVVLADYHLQEMPGSEFLSRVKEIHPDTVRIVLSGYTDFPAVTEAINRGTIYKFLSKPWEDEVLRACMRDAFRRHALEAENRRLVSQLADRPEGLMCAKETCDQRVYPNRNLTDWVNG
ncbi:MAG: EAL domain-containing protein [Acidobacteriia bacterium]|nr:EAL domain-containing protein [Terriglobia bacterium]